MDTIYIANNNEIRKIDLSSANPIIEDYIDNNQQNLGLLLYGNDIFVSNGSPNYGISKYDFPDQTDNPEDIVSPPASGNWKLIDYNNVLYYSDVNTNTIFSLDLLDANASPEVFYSGINRNRGLAIYEEHLYVAEWDSPGKIYKLPLNETNPVPLVLASNFSRPHDIVFNNGYVYISLQFADKIVRADLTQEPPYEFEDVIDNITNPKSLTFDGNYLYFLYIPNVNVYALARFDTSTLNLDTQGLNPDLELYPNPTPGNLNLYNLRTAADYSIYDIQGRLLESGRAEPEIGLDVSALSPGRYFLRLENVEFQSFLKK